MVGVRHYCYINIGLKSLAPINGLTRLLALASCDCLHCKRRFCCELSQRIITNSWRHGRQLRQVWSEERTNVVTTHYSRVKPHSLVVADYWKSVGLVTGSNWTCYTVKRIVCRRTWPFDRSSHFCCQRVHRSIRTTEDVKIFLVVRRGWQLRINRRSVIEEVRERETHDDISSEESTSLLHLLWDLNACAIH